MRIFRIIAGPDHNANQIPIKNLATYFSIFFSLTTFKFSICIFLLNKFVLETNTKKNKLETIMYDLIFRCRYSLRSFEYKFFLFFVSKWFLHRIILAFMLTHSLYAKVFAVYAACLYKRVFCFFICGGGDGGGGAFMQC